MSAQCRCATITITSTAGCAGGLCSRDIDVSAIHTMLARTILLSVHTTPTRRLKAHNQRDIANVQCTCGVRGGMCGVWLAPCQSRAAPPLSPPLLSAPLPSALAPPLPRAPGCGSSHLVRAVLLQRDLHDLKQPIRHKARALGGILHAAAVLSPYMPGLRPRAPTSR